MASLYAQYIKEREGKFCLEVEGGFASYEFLEDGVYIEDIFVAKSYRKKDLARMMMDQIIEIARSKDFKKIYGSVSPTANGATTSLKVLLAGGFKLLNASPELIMFYKEI